MRFFPLYLNQLLLQLHGRYKLGKELKQLLRQAAQCLPADVVALPDVSRATFQDFYLYLAQDEFELAMEVLEELASGARPSASFWHLLAQAAKQMKCALHERRYVGYQQASKQSIGH